MNRNRLYLVVGGFFIVVIAVALTFFLVQRHYGKNIDKLKQENQQLWSDYNQKIGEAKAHEQTAQEWKAKADALKTAIEEGNKNVKQLDANYEKAVQDYEQQKQTIGDCAAASNPDECWKQQRELLCKELREAGFKCPE